jgi:hypothetical protein
MRAAFAVAVPFVDDGLAFAAALELRREAGRVALAAGDGVATIAVHHVQPGAAVAFAAPWRLAVVAGIGEVILLGAVAFQVPELLAPEAPDAGEVHSGFPVVQLKSGFMRIRFYRYWLQPPVPPAFKDSDYVCIIGHFGHFRCLAWSNPVDNHLSTGGP